jgi:hypothetical protein
MQTDSAMKPKIAGGWQRAASQLDMEAWLRLAADWKLGWV